MIPSKVYKLYRMFFSLSYELITLVESFHEVPYWKKQFSQDVLPQLDKGWRLIGVEYDGEFCFDCLHGEACEIELYHPNYEWVSNDEVADLLDPKLVYGFSGDFYAAIIRTNDNVRLIKDNNNYYDDVYINY